MNKAANRIFSLLLMLVLTACSFPGNSIADSPPPPPPLAEVIFQVTVPQLQDENPQYFLEIVDEVTGLPFHSTRYALTAIDNNHYFGRIPFNIGSILKYRYIRQNGIPMIEYTTANIPVRYRLHQVLAPAILEDTVAGWEDTPYQGPTGALSGTVTTGENIPIPNAMAIAGGKRTFTDSGGNFRIDGLPVGMQNLAVISLDGSSAYFEQGARIAENAVTPARVFTKLNNPVNISFEVTPPFGLEPGVPIRLIGELYQLGNTYADLKGGMNTISSRAPLLLYDPGRNIYTGTISLPSGSFFQYKYSTGDGFWNAEVDESGQFRLRDLTVPVQDTIFHDTIGSFSTPGMAPIEIPVMNSAVTPYGDSLSIQFNPFTWMGSIPMRDQGNNQWKFVITSPLNMVGQTMLGICRNGQCGFTDGDLDGQTTTFQPSTEAQSVPLRISNWEWMNDQGVEITSPGPITGKDPGFIRGVELSSAYHPGWQPYFSVAFADIRAMQANWVFLTPTWTQTDWDPAEIMPIPGQNPMWQDLTQQIQVAGVNSFLTALYPSLKTSSNEYSLAGGMTRAEWENWFSAYRSFLVFIADNAAVNQAGMLILGDPGVGFSFPSQIAVTDLNAEESAQFSTDQWLTIIAEVRSHYPGRVFWAYRHPSGVEEVPSFRSQLDGYYLIWDGSLSYPPGSAPDTLLSQISAQFDDDRGNSIIGEGKPILVGLWLNSSSSAETGCSATDTGCFTPSSMPDDPDSSVVDLQKQENLYSAALTFFSSQSWVSGIISRGFYPPAALMDSSSSVHGKPAGETIAIWFQGLAGDSK